MKEDFEKFREREAQVVVVAPHDAGRVKKYWEKDKFPFTGIPDPDHGLANLYGQQWNLAKLGRMPALFVIDRQGMLAFTHYGRSMADIPSPDELLAVIDGLPKPAPVSVD